MGEELQVALDKEKLQDEHQTGRQAYQDAFQDAHQENLERRPQDEQEKVALEELERELLERAMVDKDSEMGGKDLLVERTFCCKNKTKKKRGKEPLFYFF